MVGKIGDEKGRRASSERLPRIPRKSSKSRKRKRGTPHKEQPPTEGKRSRKGIKDKPDGCNFGRITSVQHNGGGSPLHPSTSVTRRGALMQQRPRSSTDTLKTNSRKTLHNQISHSHSLNAKALKTRGKGIFSPAEAKKVHTAEGPSSGQTTTQAFL